MKLITASIAASISLLIFVGLLFGVVSNPGSNFLTSITPVAPANDFPESEFAPGYIVVLPELSLAEKKSSLDRDLKLNAIAKNKRLIDHKKLLVDKQASSISAMKKIAPKLKVKDQYLVAINGLSVDMSAEDAGRVMAAGYQISRDRKAFAILADSVPLIDASDVWALKDASERDVTGQGIRIAIVDTGIDYTHPDLGGCFGQSCKVAGGYDLYNNDADPRDDHGHGTHVAAIAAGGGAQKGVAPDATLYAYKVLASNGTGAGSIIIAGINRALDPNQDGDLSDAAHVINLSVGMSGNPDDAASRAVDNASNAGVVVAAAAGNKSVFFNSISSPGTARKALTVGASTKTDAMATFSLRGPVLWSKKTLVKPDFTAPGESICAARYDSAFATKPLCNSDTSHVLLSGTSMATPHVAGAAALIRQMHPDWNPNQIKSALKTGAADIGYTPLDRGSGRINVLAAINRTTLPPTAQLEPISTINVTRAIAGSLTSNNFKKWTLDYAPLGSNEMTILAQSFSAPVNDTVFALYTFDTALVPEGEYIVRFQVEENDGDVALDYGYIKVSTLVNISTNSGGAKTIAAGSNAVAFAKYNLSSKESSEDIRFDSFPLQFTYSGNPAGINTCQLFTISNVPLNTGSNIVNPSSAHISGEDITFQLDAPLIMSAGTVVKSLILKCNVASNTANGTTYQWGLKTAPVAFAVGSGRQANIVINPNPGPVYTISAPAGDIVSPTATITAPISGTTYTTPQNVVFAVSATDNVGVTKVEFYDGSSLRSTDTDVSNGWTFSWGVTYTANGSHTFTAKAYDAAGNSATSSPVNITVNIPPPTPKITIQQPGPYEQLGTGAPYSIIWQTQGPVTNFTLVLNQVDQNDASIVYDSQTIASNIVPPCCPQSYTWNIPTTLATGFYTIDICGAFTVDPTYLCATSEIVSIQAPFIKIINPTAGVTVTQGQAYTITWDAAGISSEITLKLMKNNQIFQTIGTAGSLQRSFSWTPNSSVGTGTNIYKIYITGKTVNGTLKTNLSPAFSIMAAAN